MPNPEMVGTIESEILLANQEASFNWDHLTSDVADSERLTVSVLTVELPPDESCMFLVVNEDNIKLRRRRDDPDNATWFIRHPEADSLLAAVDAVIVQYGYATAGGGIALESSGNQHKGNFRRLARAKDIGPEGEYGFREISTTFSQHNLRALFSGRAMKDIGDYQAGIRK